MAPITSRSPAARAPAESPATASSPRRGAVLIVVVGLSMVLLGVAVSFMMSMRSAAVETRFLIAEGQARLMLHAAMMYLQESSRLGWGEETYGWTDIRDGSLGPRPTRNFRFRTDYQGVPTATLVDGAPDGIYGVPSAPSDYNIPAPIWWRGSWPRYRAYPDETNPTQFPSSDQRVWPCPGAIGRFPMAVPVQPPYATQLRYAYNPIHHDPSVPEYENPGWDSVWDPTWNPGDINWWAARSPGLIVNPTFDPAGGATGMLDPQPQADKWNDPAYVGSPGQRPSFISGAIQPGGVSEGDWPHLIDDGTTTTRVQLAVRPGLENICWFRIYRETQADHDNDGNPAYDRVALYDPKNPSLRNWNVFVIACGAGSTRGYRFWDVADLTQWEAANGLPPGTVSRGQEFAVDSPIFSSGFDVSSFHALLASSRILWYRVEWTPMQGGGWDSANFGFVENTGWNVAFQNLEGAYPYASNLRSSSPKTYGGNFKWVQRLDHPPPNW